MPLSHVPLATIFDRIDAGYDFNASIYNERLQNHPKHLTSEQIHRRHARFRFLFQLLKLADSPPAEGDFLQSVATTIAINGPGSYGSMETDDEGNTVLVLDEDVLSSVPNATVVSIDGSDAERLTVLYHIPQFLEHCPYDCVNIMIPRLCEEAIKWNEEAQLAIASALFLVAQGKIPQQVARQIACSSLTITGLTESEEVFDAFTQISSVVIQELHRYHVLHYVALDLMDRAQSQSVYDRRLAAFLIGSISHALSPDELNVLYADTAIALIHDQDHITKATMVNSMASFAAKLPIEITEEEIWPRLAQLVNHESVDLRVVSIRALAKSAGELHEYANSSNLFSKVLHPLFLHSCNNAIKLSASDLCTVSDEAYAWLEVFSEVFGPFFYTLSPLMSKKEDRDIAIRAFRMMATCNGPAVRHWCAFNLPGVSLVCSRFMASMLSRIIPALAGDADNEVRITLAKGIHETTKCLYETNLRGELLTAVSMLVRDKNASVRMSCLRYFHELYVLLSPKKPSTVRVPVDSSGKTLSMYAMQNVKAMAEDAELLYDEEMKKMDPLIASLETTPFDTWRVQDLLSAQIEITAPLIMQKMLCDHVAPLLFRMAKDSSASVRKSSMRALMYVLRYIPDIRHYNHIIKHFKSEWARGKVYWTRLAFIEGADSALDVFSTGFFTDTFCTEILHMHKDPVVNVRIRLVYFLEKVARLWKEKHGFCVALERLCIDADPQVRSEALILRDRLPLIQGMTTDELEADQRKQAAEEAFYVKKVSKKKRKTPTVSPNGHSSFANVAQPRSPGRSRTSPRSPSTAQEFASRGNQGVARNVHAMASQSYSSLRELLKKKPTSPGKSLGNRTPKHSSGSHRPRPRKPRPSDPSPPPKCFHKLLSNCLTG